MKLKAQLRRLIAAFVALFGSRIIDERTGQPIARAFLFCWRGKIYVIGYQGGDQVRPGFLPQKRMTHWKRKIGFATYPAPDFPREGRPGSPS